MASKILQNSIPVYGNLSAVSSKSHLHRLIICASVADKPCQIRYAAKLPDDVLATVSCLQKLGADIRIGEQVIDIRSPITKKIYQDIRLNCKQSGSTLRFLLPLAAFLCKGYLSVTGDPLLAKRPIEPLCSCLEGAGASFDSHKLPLGLQRGFSQAKSFTVCGNISSQFLTGLLLVAPLCGASVIHITTEIKSKPYLDYTMDVMKTFGVDVCLNENTLTVTGTYRTPAPVIEAEGDWSSAAFFLAGVTEKPLTVTGLSETSLQADKAVLAVLQDMGMQVEPLQNAIRVCAPTRTTAFTFDASNAPDLVPILCVRAAVSKGTSILSGISRLRYKESDRITSVMAMIEHLGGNIRLENDCVYIDGVKRLTGGTVDGFGDHRIVMAAAMAAVFCENPVTVTDAEAVSKSYPTFFEDFETVREHHV